jgi:hypothetical protein
VHDPARVRRVECAGDLVEPAERLRLRRPPRREAVGDRAAGHVLHDDERAALGLTHVVDRDNMCLAGEPGGRKRLPREPRAELRIGGHVREEHLDRDVATEDGVGGAVDLAHPALADLEGVVVTVRKIHSCRLP